MKLWVMAAAALTVSGAMGAGSLRSPGESQGFASVSRPSDTRALSFGIRGKIADVSVKPGDRVMAGAPIARLEDTVQARNVNLAELAAKDDAILRAAESTRAFREDELRRTVESEARGGAGDADVREARYRAEQSRIDVDAAKRQAEENQITLAREQARLNDMRIASPIDAIVQEVHRRPGESLDELTPVVTVVSIDPLWLDVSVPTRVAMGLNVGQSATVTWDDMGDRPAMSGKIVFKSPTGSAGARQLQVRVEVPNPEGLPAGLHGVVRFTER